MPEMTDQELEQMREELSALASDLPGTLEALPPEEREAYEVDQQSVIDARLKAEAHEGLLQVI